MSGDFNLQEESISLTTDPEAYTISHELEVPSCSTAELDAHLSSAIDSVVNDPDSITHSSPTTFDVFRSILKYADSPNVSASILTKTLDQITSSLVTHANAVVAIGYEDMDAPMAHKTPLEMWAFLLQWFVVIAERGAGKSEETRAVGRGAKATKSKKSTPIPTTFIWADHIPHVLATMSKALRVPTQRIWRTSSEREAFVSCFTKPAYQLAETEAYLKNQEIKMGIYKVICLAVKFHSHAFGAQTSIIQNLTYFEHLAEYMAELLSILEKEFDFNQLGEEILRDVASKSFAHNDQKGPKVFSRFLVRFAELSPGVVQKQMALLLSHLDSEAYPMRIAIIEIVGILIQDISLSDEGDEEQKKKQVKKYFELLMERFLDLNAFVRGKVMSTIYKLCDLKNKYPKQRAQITELAIRTLEDKTATCRKNAIQLLHKLIQTHPFGAIHGGSLHAPEWQAGYDQLMVQLEKVDAHELEEAKRQTGMGGDEDEADDKVEKEDDDEDEDEEGDEVEPKAERGEAQEGEEAEPGEEGDVAEPKKKVSKTKKKPRQSQLDISALQAEQSNLDPNFVMQLRLAKKYYTDALRFINAIEGAVPILAQLLVSTNKSEALEAIRFFRIAYEYKFVGAEVGIKTMIHLIWTKDNTSTGAPSEVVEAEKGIRGSLIETYKSLYFDVVPDLNPRQQVNRIAKNMIERTYDATLAELTSLEELMRTMMLEGGADGGVHEDVINKLWQVYSTDTPVPKPQRQGAIIILGMLAVAKREVVTEQVENLLKIGLGQHGMNDLVLARYTCVALQRLGGSAKKVKGSLADKTMRLPMENPIFQKLQDIIERAPRTPQWFGMAEQAINTIYLLGEQPDQLCSQIIKNLTEKAFHPRLAEVDINGERATTPTQGDDEGDDDIPPTPATLMPPDTPAIPPTPAWSMPATPGMERTNSQTSLQEDSTPSFGLAQLVFTVGHVAIKHIVYLELVERELKRRKDEQVKLKAAEKNKEKEAASNDLDAVTGNAEDDIGDTVAGIREKEILYGEKSLLRVYGPLIAAICATPRKYRSPSLRLAATLALTKLMCVSGQYCEGHLLLLLKILETSRDPSIRSNIVIALGDIAVSFGNIMDDNAERLYQGLSDTSGSVKKNTLMVLTHLILNGMIKVKGQLGEMAKCLEDPDPRISDLAKLFFKELSTKDNALYNNLQDVISHLSVGKFKVDEESFEKTMRFIFTFIEKDKQAESIVEKLCQRYRLATDERQWRDIAFCLSLLPYKSERSMKKLIEGLPFYQDKLHEEKVFQRFSEILTKARQNRNPGKPETELKEFEAILAEHQAKGLEEQALEADVAKKTKAAKRRAAKRGAATGSATAAAVSRKGSETPVRNERPKRGRRRAAVESDEEEDE